jgi:4'-phosphopantetheinyl transferase
LQSSAVRLNPNIVPQQAMTQWPGVADEVRLPPHEVHIWSAGLHLEGAALCACWDLLSREETRRASTYRFAKDRREFVVTRAVLRQILADYTDQPAAALCFDSSSSGKPVLRGRQDLHFSVSHSSDLALFAVARKPVGIDVEHRHSGMLWQTAVAHYLSPREQSYVQALPVAARTVALYRCWTRKEAVLKAFGTGLLYPPQQVSVLPESKKPSVVSLLGRNWVVRQVPAPRGYAAAVAIEESSQRIKWRRWKFPVTTLFRQRRTDCDSAKSPAANLTHLPVLSIELGAQGSWR